MPELWNNYQMINLQEAAAILRPREQYPAEWGLLPYCVTCETFQPIGMHCECPECGKTLLPHCAYTGPDFIRDDDASRALFLWYCLEWLRNPQVDCDTIHAVLRLIEFSEEYREHYNDTFPEHFSPLEWFTSKISNPEAVLYAAIKETTDAH